MARHYSTKDFFRQMPNALLERYFRMRRQFESLDFRKMKEGDPKTLFQAWLALPDTARNEMDAELRDISEMSCEKGFLAILDEARWHLRAMPDQCEAFVETLSALPNHFERAMVTFLDHQAFWQGATRFYHADTLTFWRKRKNLPQVAAAVDPASILQLADLMRTYFHDTEGRGKNCLVEPYRRGGLDYFFCYPEDHSQRSIEWVDGAFNPRPHNPAFEVIYVYSQQNGTLDLNYRGSRKSVEPLQGIFATAILKLDTLPPDPKDERVYDLNPMVRRDFSFSHEIGSGIDRVAVKLLRLSSRIKAGDRITLEADVSDDPNAIHALLDEIGRAIPLPLYNVTLVELAVVMTAIDDKPPKRTTIRISYPNSCSLKYDETGLKLRAMLEASGIEPRDHTEPAAPEAGET